MIKILLLIDYSSEFDRKLLRGLVQYSKENGPWLFYRLPSYYSGMYGEKGILKWAKEWKADAIIGQWNNDTVNLLKELNIPIIALSQLNRGVESREGEEGKRPQLSDLRESGAIEQDADMVCFIHRPEYYKIYTSQDGTDLRGMAEIIIAKHRNGAVGDVRLRFIGQYTRFQNPEDDMVIPHPAEGGGATFGSKMNAVSDGSVPPPAEFAPQTDNPFGGVGSDGPLPF